MKEKVFLVIFSLISFALFSFAFIKIYYFPSPKQKEKEEEKFTEQVKKVATRTAFEYEVNYLDKLPEIYEKHKSSLAQLPPFSPPEDNHLTQEQIDKYWITYHTCAERIKELRQKYLQQIKVPIAKALATVKYSRWVYTTCLVEGLDHAQMTEKEFNWVKKRVWESALFIVNCLLDSSPHHPQREQLKRTQQALCRILQLYDEEKGQYFPEKLNLEKIPRSNIELLLNNKDKIRWQDVHFEQLEIDSDLVMKCARQLLAE